MSEGRADPMVEQAQSDAERTLRPDGGDERAEDGVIPAMPDVIRSRLLPPTEPKAAERGALLGDVRRRVADAWSRAPIQPAVRDGVARLNKTVAKRLPARSPGWTQRVQMPSLPPLPPLPEGLAKDILERGRRAGVAIGGALDKVAGARPAAVEPDEVLPETPDDGIKTVAIARAVERPSIFALGNILTAVIAGALIHIVTTFAVTALGNGSAYHQLRGALPANQTVVLPPLKPGAQVLPFLEPDMLYAMCRFDLSQGPVALSALLPEGGWSLALYTRTGDNFYAAPGLASEPTAVRVLLEPTTDRLINVEPGARVHTIGTTEVFSPDMEGLMVVRAPLKGTAFEVAANAALHTTACTPVKR